MAPRRRYKLDDKLPCDVHLPPRTIIRKGCSIATLMTALAQRETWSDEDTTLLGRVDPRAGRVDPQAGRRALKVDP